ncbi:hypothetical protein CC85DRAFT_299066 [Cutaneotrichosporon oleaginosum]|uniref:Dolichyl-diphosphooligosaccharide--protein glycosyltransferase subunit 4 n=1 Tax=Cutaneotrichosporon oleaginosum TaxID=879819 RepID=A0A0J0XXS5_9TREE|nr:uncharacterized protein CC85DRAFT_299066 [Cutaneotrichosporon oleaginosum]KLT45880.1 hypothetical protein CC85DRAFT_299066 [Cutaneotrichosporon oleaginosum]TXT06581.1 hypothetical protein COLE_05912 [Cutaneotrichosporon oleaginosum]
MTSDVSTTNASQLHSPTLDQRNLIVPPQNPRSRTSPHLTLPYRCPSSRIMISDGTLTDLSNGLGVAAMVLIIAYHFVAVNGKRIKERQ